jgi:hypothetical protein
MEINLSKVIEDEDGDPIENQMKIVGGFRTY